MKQPTVDECQWAIRMFSCKESDRSKQKWQELFRWFEEVTDQYRGDQEMAEWGERIARSLHLEEGLTEHRLWLKICQVLLARAEEYWKAFDEANQAYRGSPRRRLRDQLGPGGRVLRLNQMWELLNR